ncbi:MAG: glycosyltransferase [Planctomycetota bacterium]|nr:glycosyltransferase [Planctomycetota bacterium]MDA1252454.1 glycosyltransferase [Planctomycetota bacterium]
MSADEACLVAGWCLFGLVAFHALPALLWLPFRTLWRVAARSAEPDRWPLVTVIIAARDEDARVEVALQRLLSSDYPNVEIVFANDRSSDSTGEIADRIAAEDSRVLVLHLDEVPDGWLGKTNAMSRAAEQARGEWLLFTDGDILIEPATLRLVIRHAEAKKLNHFCLLPSMETAGWMECVLTSFFAMLFCFGTYPWLRGTRFPMAYYGVGAFNLVRRTAYEEVGGFESIRMDVMDDVNLGRLLRDHEARADLLVAGDAVRVRWQESAWGVVRGLEKNAFANCRYSVARLIGFTLFYSAIFFLPIAAVLCLDVVAASGFAASLVLLVVSFGCLSRLFGGHLTVGPWLPVGAVAVLLAFWRSAVITLRQGGVRWRDTFYPIETLRASLYRRSNVRKKRTTEDAEGHGNKLP